MPKYDADHTTVVITAGGRGVRLWPLSTAGRPKPFRCLLADRTMIQLTFERAQRLVPRDNIYVVTSCAHAALARAQLPDLPARNLLVEPESRDTAPAIGYAAVRIAERVPDAVMVLLASDHHITPLEPFQESVARAVLLARQGDFLVSLGIPPTAPNVEYGYMKCGAPLASTDAAYHGEGYVEKPDRDTAAALVQAGSYLWNINIFAWKIDTLLRAMQTYRPDLYEPLRELRQVQDETAAGEVERLFRKLPRVSIDYAIMERVQPGDRFHHLFVKADFRWSDIGNLPALADTLEPDAAGNRCRGAVEATDCDHCLLIAEPPARLRVARLSHRIVLAAEEGDVLVAPLAPGRRLADLLQAPLSQSAAPGGPRVLVNAPGVTITGSGRGAVAILDTDSVALAVDGPEVTVSRRTGDGPLAEPGAVRPPTVLVCPDRAAMSDQGAALVVRELAALLAHKGSALVTLSAGATPELLYDLLRTRYRQAVDWARVALVQMDDYLDLPPDSTTRLSHYLIEKLVIPLGIRAFHRLDAGPDVTDAGLSAGEARLAGLGGLDLALHGIGGNGHIGFNEPGSSFASTARRVALAEDTRTANRRSFATADQVPRHAVTLGLALLGAARSSILVACGVAKHAAVRQAILGPTTEQVPATVLRQCSRVTYVLDESAWSGR